MSNITDLTAEMQRELNEKLFNVNNVSEIKVLIERGADVNAKDNDGCTPLHRAAFEGHIEEIKVLTEQGADINAKDNDDWTPLHHAARKDHVEAIKVLTEQGAEINAKDNYGWIPLHHASRGGHIAAIKVLTEQGAEINAKADDGLTPLHWAVIREHIEAINVLIEQGAEINAKDNNCWNPLHHAASIGHVEAINVLIEQGAEINAKDNNDWTPLHQAANYGYVEAIKVLIEHGAVINIKGGNGWTPLHHAARGGHIAAIKVLTEQGAEIYAKTNNGLTPLHHAARGGHVEAINVFIEQGAEINTKDNNDWTPLHWAAIEGHVEAIKVLTEQGAEINAKNNNGWTPLHRAASEGHVEAIKVLTEQGAEINTKDNNDLTPLHWAARGGHVEAIKVLTEQGADINVKDSNGWTLLHWAVIQGYIEAIEVLIKKRANPNIGNKTVFDIEPSYFSYDKLLLLFKEAINQDDFETIDNLLIYYNEFKYDILQYAVMQNRTQAYEYIARQEFKKTKITHQQFHRLLSNNSDKAEISVRNLLVNYDFSDDLSGLRFNASILGKVNKLDFSGLNLTNSKLHYLSSKEVNFTGANLTNANVAVASNETIMILTHADLTRSFIMGINITQENINATFRDSIFYNESHYEADQIFYQSNLIYQFPVLDFKGVCNGLVVEYAIYYLAMRNTNEQYDNFISHLNSSIENMNASLAYRVQSYQKNLQNVDNEIELDLETVFNNFMASLPSELENSDIISCSITASESRHSIAIRKIRDKESKIIGYKIFDPNFGEYHCNNTSEVNKRMNMLFHYYQSDNSNIDSSFKVSSLDKLVYKYNFTNDESQRYSLLSEKEKFIMRIESLNANSTDILDVTNTINNMTIEEINEPILRGDGQNRTLLCLTAHQANYEIFSLLLEKGANMTAAMGINRTIIHCAAVGQNPKIVDIAVGSGANIDAQNEYGITALYIAALNKKISTGTVSLIKHGANPHLKTNDGDDVYKLNPELFSDEAIIGIYKEVIASNDTNSFNNMLTHYNNAKIHLEISAYVTKNDFADNLPKTLVDNFMHVTESSCYGLTYSNFLYECLI